MKRDVENNVSEGIKTLSSYLAMGDLKISRKCKNLIGEIQGYCWDPKASEKGLDEPIKRADHLIDALRYACFSYFGSKLKLSAPSQEQLEGASLDRNARMQIISTGPFMPDTRNISQQPFSQLRQSSNF